MAVESGKNGKVLVGATTIAEITQWVFNTEAETTRYASSATGGHKRSVAGTRMGDGTIDFKLDVADPITDDFDSGDSLTLLLYLDSTRFYSVPATIKKMTLTTNIDTGEVIGGNFSFETNGAWTKPTYS